MLKTVPQEIIDFINKYSAFYILGHEEPDGDCLGSQKATASFLKRLGKKNRSRFTRTVHQARDEGK